VQQRGKTNTRIKILINYFFGPLIFILLCWSIYRQLIHQPDLAARWTQMKGAVKSRELWAAVLLSGVNWGIESRKWQLLVQHLQAFRFTQAVKSVLAGCTITLFTPNRIGEYGGRILFIEPENRLKAISLNIAASISQLLVTLIMGCAGLWILRHLSQEENNAFLILPGIWSNAILFISLLIILALLLLYLRIGFWVRLIEKIPGTYEVVKHIAVLEELDREKLLRLMFLSLLRYGVFVAQYMLLLHAMGVELNWWTCFWTITVFYLLVTAAPSLGLVELPLRITALWALLKYHTSNEIGVSGAALSIWIINLVLPALAGSFLILGVKIFRGKNV
jgi:uncharacterized membrane protein YbhN (UPF0104 family)